MPDKELQKFTKKNLENQLKNYTDQEQQLVKALEAFSRQLEQTRGAKAQVSFMLENYAFVVDEVTNDIVVTPDA